MIYVCDALMGSGKSTAAITYMLEHPDKKFLYITPYNDEVKRIVTGCAAREFHEPKELPQFGKSKVLHTAWMMKHGWNIASTHQAFLRYQPEFIQQIKDAHYTLLIDENLSPMQKIPINPSYMRAAKAAGYIEETEQGVLRLKNPNDCGEFDENLFQLMQTHDLIVVGNGRQQKSYYWILPPEFLMAFDDVIIMTYLFEGQGLYTMLQMYKISFQYVGIERDELSGISRFSTSEFFVPSYVSDLPSMIKIVDNVKMNAIGDGYYGLSKTKYLSGEVDLDAMKRHVSNYFKNQCGVPAEQRMWSTFKGYEDTLSGNGYASRFRPCNLRAVNTEDQCKAMAYLINLFVNRGQAMFFQSKGVDANDDLYALSTMIQWIWRSAIRRGEQVEIYLPSSRMRDLLDGWMGDVAAGQKIQAIQERKLMT